MPPNTQNLQQQIDEINSKLSLMGRDTLAGIVDVNSYMFYGANTHSGLVIEQFAPSVKTTDATVTTIQTVIIPNNAVVTIEARVVAQRTGGSAGATGDGAAYIRRGTYTVTTTYSFTATVLAAATSATLSTNWLLATGAYTVTFSNGDVRQVTFTNGATTATWAGGLSSNATASFTASVPTPVLIGSVQDGYTAESQAAYDCTLDISGSTVRVRVTGVANTNMTWSSTILTKTLIL